jgi:hypothetical protein
VKPSPESLDLTWQSMKSSCARKLQQCNMQTEAKKIQELSLEMSFDLKKLTHLEIGSEIIINFPSLKNKIYGILRTNEKIQKNHH